jgi:hypothetical protein
MVGKGGPPPIEHQCGVKTHAGRPCRKPKVRGANTCVTHGGLRVTPEKRKRRIAEVELRKEAIKFGAAVDIDPASFMLERLAMSNGLIKFLEGKLIDAGLDDLLHQMSVETQVGKLDEYKKVTVTEAISPILSWYVEERKIGIHLADCMIKNGLAAAFITLHAEEVAMYVRGIRHILTDLGIDHGAPHVREIVGARLDELGQEAEMLRLQVVR